MKTFFKFVNYTLVTLLVIIAAILTYVAIPIFGNKALIVRSGSMEPTVKAGDLIVVNLAKGINSPLPKDIGKYKEGDIIAFKGDKNANVVTTHRVVSKRVTNSKILYQTQGDANNSPDTQLVSEDLIIGKSVLTIPKAGELFAFAKTKQGFALLVLIPALLVIGIESINLVKEIIKIMRARRMLLEDPQFEVEKGALLGPISLRVLFPFVLGIMFFHNSYAFFSDSASSLTNTFITAQIFSSPTPTPTPSPSPSPSPVVQVRSVVINEIMWAGSQGNSADEWIELRNMTGNAIDLSSWVVENLGEGSGPARIITIPLGHIISANGLFLISNDIESTSIISVTPDFQTSGVSLQNNGEQLTLKNNLGNTIDIANINGAWFFGDDPPGQTPKKSMERNSVPGDGTVSTNWHTATTQTNIDVGAGESATPKAVNSAP